MKTTFESESDRDEEILSLFLYKSPKRLQIHCSVFDNEMQLKLQFLH